jgi:hypothetical protein
MVIIKQAIKDGITLPAIEQMEKDLVKAMEKSTQQRKIFKK